MSKADPTKLKKIRELGCKEIAFSVSRVPHSQQLYYGASDGNVYSVDFAAEKPEPQAMSGHTSYVQGVAVAGPWVVSGGFDCQLIWWNAETRERVRQVEGHSRWIRNLAATPDGKLVASVADDMLCKVWNVETGELVYTLTDHKPITPHDYPSMLYAVAISADGTLLATGDKVGHVAIWDLAAGKKIGEVESPGMYTWDPRQRRHSIGGIRSLTFSADNKLLAVGGIGKINNIDHLDGPTRLEVFDWKEGKSLYVTEDDKMKGLVEQLAFDPTGEWLLGAGGDHGGFLNFYTVKDGKILHQEKAPMHVHGFSLSESFDTLFCVGHGKLALYELKAAEEAAEAKPAEETKAG